MWNRSDIRAYVQMGLRRFGYELRRVDAHRKDVNARGEFFVQELPHSRVAPFATYSPWLADREFVSTYEFISTPKEFPHTLVDRYRCYELWQLASRRVEGDVLEIGVWRGGTGCLIAKRLQSSAPGKTVYLCDTFAGIVGVTEKDPHYRDGEHSDTSQQIVIDLATRMGLTNIQIMPGIFPAKTAIAIANHAFSLVHIDVDVYKSARECFAWSLPRLSIGGAVVFDDYGFERCGGVTRLVNEIVLQFENCLATIHNLNGHAVLIKTAAAPSLDHWLAV